MPTMRSASKFLSAAASAAATAMLVGKIAHDFAPEEVHDYLNDVFRAIPAYFSNQLTMSIEESEGLVSNEIYAGAEIYLGSRVPSSSRRMKVNKPEKENIVVRMDESGEEVIDVFNGAVFRWRLTYRTLFNERKVGVKSSNGTQYALYIKLYTLRFDKKHKQMVLDEYLPYILKESKSIKQEKKTLKIFTMNIDGVWGTGDIWTPMQLDHPSNFETLAMDSKLKEALIEDLDTFVSTSSKEYYRRVGKAWKRGYLLYGPPGTGKTSLIAAMANYLQFDVYDMDLTELDYNSELRTILLATANRSILVFEDIDCSVDFQDRKETKNVATVQKKVITLSGFLNFIDGLWSCVGDERIIVFTTNHKEKLDPALLRPGRMDMHIHMSYCTPSGFKTLAKSYLRIEKHHLFEEIEGCIEKAEVTPAKIAEELMKGNDPDVVLSGLVEFLHKKKIEYDQAKEKAAKEAEEANRKAKEVEEANRKAEEAAKEVEESNRKAKEAEEANRMAKEAAKEVEEANRKAEEAAKEVEEANRKAKEVEEANRMVKEAAEKRAETEKEEKVKETQIKEKENERSRERKTATWIKRATIVIVVLLLMMILIPRGMDYEFVFQVISY